MTARHPIVRQDGPDVLLAVRVHPRTSRNQVICGVDRVALRLTALPVEGAANAACCAYLAELLDLPKSCISVMRGQASREKLLRIADSDAARVLARLQAAASGQT